MTLKYYFCRKATRENLMSVHLIAASPRLMSSRAKYLTRMALCIGKASMSRVTKSLFLGLLASALVTGCGNGSQSGSNTNAASGTVASPDIGNLQVSNDPNNLKENDLNYVPVIKGKQTKILYFKAPSDGELSYSTMTGVVGSNCDDQKKDPNQFITVTMENFQVSLSTNLKDRKTGKFSIQAQADNNDGILPPLQPSIPMKAGDEIEIGVELDSPANCDNATAWINVAFAPPKTQQANK
jgi:hypothetical protein